MLECCAIPKILLMKRELMKSAQVIYSRIQSQGFHFFSFFLFEDVPIYNFPILLANYPNVQQKL